MFRGVRWLTIAILSGVTLALAAPGHLLSAPMPVQPTQNLISFPSQVGLPDPNTIFDAVNQTRSLRGLPALQKDTVLTRVAMERAIDMQKRAYYAHKSPDGLLYYDLLFQERVGFDYSCENLDLEFVTTTDTYVNDWMNSNKGHRECMLNATTTRAGYAVATLYTDPDTPAYVVVAIHATTD